LNALAFLYNKFLNKPLGDVSQFRRVRKQPKIPTVLTRQEVASLMSHLQGTQRLVGSLLYGSGLRRSVALLVAEVLPEQPIRQWVLSFPFQLRFLFASRP
jgi:integrase